MTNHEAGFDPVGWWPDLFEGLQPAEVRAFVQAWASNWHEGWQPNREDVEVTLRQFRGEITEDEMVRLAVEQGRARRAQG